MDFPHISLRCNRTNNFYLNPAASFRVLPEFASGLATGASWLCYFKALQLGNASQVVPVDKFSIVLTVILAVVFLNETLSLKTIVGCILITIGTLVMI